MRTVKDLFIVLYIHIVECIYAFYALYMQINI